MKKYLEIVSYLNDQVIRRFDVTKESEHNANRLDRGVNINMNHEDYYTRFREYKSDQVLNPPHEI